jgi:hypothetical protein
MLINLEAINNNTTIAGYADGGDINGPSQTWDRLPVHGTLTWTKTSNLSTVTWTKQTNLSTLTWNRIDF